MTTHVGSPEDAWEAYKKQRAENQKLNYTIRQRQETDGPPEISLHSLFAKVNLVPLLFGVWPLEYGEPSIDLLNINKQNFRFHRDDLKKMEKMLEDESQPIYNIGCNIFSIVSKDGVTTATSCEKTASWSCLSNVDVLMLAVLLASDWWKEAFNEDFNPQMWYIPAPVNLSVEETHALLSAFECR